MATPMTLISKKSARNKALLRQLVQDCAHDREIDPDAVEPTLSLAGISYDEFESLVGSLQQSLKDQAAFDAQGFESQISALEDIQRQARAKRIQLDAEQASLNVRWQELRDMEERASYLGATKNARDSQRSQLLHKRRQRLGTDNLEEFPVIN